MTWQAQAAAAAGAGLAAGVAARRLYSTILESQHAAPGQITQNRPNTDPQQQTAASLLSFNNTARIVIGTITDSTALANCYRIQLEKGKQPITALFVPRTSISAFGPQELTTLQPGTSVLVVLHPQLMYGLIFGVLPPPAIFAQLVTPSILACASRQRVDAAHKKPLQMHAAGHIGNWLAGRPFDLTTGGEKGWITETGVRIMLDSFMAQLGVDEACSVTAFQHDQLLRLAAYNLQFWTAGSEREGFNDQAEYDEFWGVTPYPWEQMGLFAVGDPKRVISPEDWQIKTPWYAKWEPQDDHQLAWHRTRAFHGYFGQGGKQLVQAGPVAAQPGDYASYAGGQGLVGAQHPALLDEWRGLDGRLAVQSAKGISIVKRVGAIAPVRLRRPEEPASGDNPDNYKFSGLAGSGPEHKITGGPAASAADTSLQRAAGVLDLHAYIFNYAGVHPFYWHANDWKVHEESQLAWTDGATLKQGSLDFSKLASSMFLPPPAPLRVKIDHRYGEQDYYQTECGIDWLEDGGMLIYDGAGSELRMAAGSSELTSPGDVWLRSGRNVNLWAGYDAVVRAKNSVDVTSTSRDVRLKAGLNIQVLASAGGVLVESRAEQPSYNFEGFGEDAVFGGVILRAPSAEIVGWGSNIYLRTGGGTVGTGVITLDAAKGEHDVVVHARQINNFLTEGEFQFFGRDGEIEKANEFSKDFCTVVTPMFVGGSILAAGDIINRGWLIATQGHIATEYAEQFSQLVAPMSGEGLRRSYDSVSQGEERGNTTLPATGQQLYSLELDTPWYNARRPGNDDVMEKGEFSFRLLSQYRTEDFKLYESRWQQMARLSGLVLPVWEEAAVKTQGRPLYPYPGKENFEADVFVTQNLSIFQFPEGHSADRGEPGNLNSVYADPQYAEPTPHKLDTYTVIR